MKTVVALLFLATVVVAHHHHTLPDLPKDILYEDRSGMYDPAHPAPRPAPEDTTDQSKLVKIITIKSAPASIDAQPAPKPAPEDSTVDQSKLVKIYNLKPAPAEIQQPSIKFADNSKA